MSDASTITRQKLALALIGGKKSRLTTDNDTTSLFTESTAITAGLKFVNPNKRAVQASALAILKRVTGPSGYRS